VSTQRRGRLLWAWALVVTLQQLPQMCSKILLTHLTLIGISGFCPVHESTTSLAGVNLMRASNNLDEIAKLDK
jgi:hypothetical protein